MTFGSHIEIPLPIGPISSHFTYGSLNYTIKNMKLSIVDPGLGLANVSWYRVSNQLPDDFPENLVPSLIFHLNVVSIESPDPGEALIVIGISKCSWEVRLVVLTDGHFNFVDLTSRTESSKCCSPILNGHYGTLPCTFPKERTIFLVSHGPTHHDFQYRAESKNDPPLNQKGLHFAEEAGSKLGKIDLVVSSPQDASVITGEIIADQLKVNLWIDQILGRRCGLQYESWRLLKRIPQELFSKNPIELLSLLPFDVHRICLIMDPCRSQVFLRSIGWSGTIYPSSIIEVTLQNLTGIPHWNFRSISSGLVHSIHECQDQCESPFILDLALLDGSQIDYIIPRSDLFKLTPAQQSAHIRLQYEREVWTHLYWNYQKIFREGHFQEKEEIHYWGRFPVQNEYPNNLIGIYWVELIKNIWFKPKK